jgi:hypothetical protein
LDRTNQVKGTAITGHAQLTPSESESDPFFFALCQIFIYGFFGWVGDPVRPIIFYDKKQRNMDIKRGMHGGWNY